MPQAIGAAVLVAVGASATATVAGVSVAGIIGSTILSGVLIGAQLLLAPKPAVQTPDDGKQSIKQALAPPIYGVGRGRIAGAFAFYGLRGSTSYDVIAIHQGLIDAYEYWYLNDDRIAFATGSDGFVAGYHGTARYAGGSSQDVRIYWRKGQVPETAYSQMISAFPDGWSADHRGDGVASALLICTSPDAKVFTNRFPFGLPKLSTVGRWQQCWDFRDPTQIETNPLTWKWTANPILHILKYYCHAPAGFQKSVAQVYARTAGFWLAAADRCDEIVATADGVGEKRYLASGSYTAETKRASVIEALLRCCDGWLTERGDGAVVLYAGDFFDQGLVLDERHIVDADIRRGYAEDERVNRLIVKVVSEDHKWTEVECDPWDLGEIEDGRVIVPRDAQAEWSASWRQSRRLAKIEMDKARAKVRGTLTLNAYGENVRYRRYFKLKLAAMASTADLWCEVVGYEDDTFGSNSHRVEFRSVDPARYAWTTAEEGRRPAITYDDSDDEDMPVPPEPTLGVIRETISGVPVVKISSTSPPVENWPDLTLGGRYRKVGDTSWQPLVAPDRDLQVISGVLGDGSYQVQNFYIGGGGGEGDYSPTATITVVTDATAPATPLSFTAMLSGATISLTAKAPNDSHAQRMEFRRGTPAQAFAAATVLSPLQIATANQTATLTDAPGPGVWRYWASEQNGSGVPSATPAGPVDVTVSGQTFADDFNRADGNVTTGTTWNRSAGVSGAAQVAANKLSFASTTVTTYYVETFSANHYVEGDLQTSGATTSFPLCVRVIDNSNSVGARYTGTAWIIQKKVANVFTTVASVTMAGPSAGARGRLEASGDTVTLKIAGTTIVNAASLGGSLAGATKAGFSVRAADGSVLDNLAIGIL